jgi:hypothetical protein
MLVFKIYYSNAFFWNSSMETTLFFFKFLLVEIMNLFDIISVNRLTTVLKER